MDQDMQEVLTTSDLGNQLEITTEAGNYLLDAGARICDYAWLRSLSIVGISHFHLDHVIHLDQIFRRIFADRVSPLIIGPPGTLEKMQARIQALEWNLFGDGAFMDVLCAGKRHRLQLPGGELEGTEETEAFSDACCQFQTLELDHGIPSLAFRISEHNTCNINAEAMHQRGLKPGPWVRDLKTAFMEGRAVEIEIQGNTVEANTLFDLLTLNRGRTIVYATDFAATDGNKSRVAEFAQGADVLYCESMYLEADRELATKTHHMTARDAAEIAQAAQPGALRLFHFSRRYEDTAPFPAEAAQHFDGPLLPIEP